jgi:hypothetical protein
MMRDETKTMMAVWKYPLPLREGPVFRVRMPHKAQILAFQMQGDVPTMWALVDPDTDITYRRVFRIFGTGHQEVEPSALYHGTCQIGPFVWHLFEKR